MGETTALLSCALMPGGVKVTAGNPATETGVWLPAPPLERRVPCDIRPVPWGRRTLARPGTGPEGKAGPLVALILGQGASFSCLPLTSRPGSGTPLSLGPMGMSANGFQAGLEAKLETRWGLDQGTPVLASHRGTQ